MIFTIELSNYILIASKLSKLIDQWNDKLNAFAAEHMDSPWMGPVVLGVLFVFAYWGIKSLANK